VAILITCEAAGEGLPPWMVESNSRLLAPSSTVESPPSDPTPASLTAAFLKAGPVDRCAGEISELLAARLKAPLLVNPYRADLIDVSRSASHRYLHGPLARQWPPWRKQWLVEHVYRRYRDRVRLAIEHIAAGFSFVLHVSVRSFSAKSKGRYRRTDVGLLYDPSRRNERDVCLDWIDQMYEINPNVRMRRNYPRRGTRDSLTKAMRGELSLDRYLGIELWLNRAWASRDVRLRSRTLVDLCDALCITVGVPISEAA